MPDDLLTIASGAVEARIHKQTGQIELSGPDRTGKAGATVVAVAPASAVVGGQRHTIGAVSSSTDIPNGLELVQEFGPGRHIRSRLFFPFSSVMRYEVSSWDGPPPETTSLSVDAVGNEHFYGFGEKFNSLDQAGKVVSILTFDNPGNKGDRSYKVAPWFISTRGYGFHLDSTARSLFDMRVETGRYTVTNEVGTLRVNVVYGPALTDVLSRYTGYTGRPPLPPAWAFGPWISSDIWRDGGEVRYAVETFRRRGIPVSGFVFDSPWEVAYNDFKFNIGDAQNTQFGHPGTFEGKSHAGFATVPELMTFLARSGLKAICWMTPFVNVRSNDEGVRGQNLAEAMPDKKEARFFVRNRQTGQALVVPWWKGMGSPVDFTSQAARDWLTDRLKDLLRASLVHTKSGTETAIGGFKTDDGESGNGTNTYIPDDAEYSNGQSGKEFVNGYCLEYLKTIDSVLGRNGILFARAGYTGTQAFPGCWAGDNEPNFGEENGLPSVIVAGLSAAMSGYAVWGHDVGGYQNHNFSPVSPADLFIRWTQFGCFSPIMQMHRQVDGGNLRQYPWGYADGGETIDNNRALDNFRFYANLHTRLFPYLYTYAKQSSETGLPILRPLVLIHPDDPRVVPVRHTYYFGADLLVAPIIQVNSNQRNLYLPEGSWIDFWTNQRHAGQQDILWTNPAEPKAPASKIPLFVRSGAIVPLVLGNDVQTLCDADYVNNPAVRSWDGGLEILLYPAGHSQLTLYDGTEVHCAAGAGATAVTVDFASQRRILLRILASRPGGVQRGGTALPEFPDAAGLDAAEMGWRYDTTQGVVVVKFLHTGGTSRITL
jgi:alpha-D-xyloside xylohydrolase